MTSLRVLVLCALVLLPAASSAGGGDALDSAGPVVGIGRQETPPLLLEMRLEKQTEGRFVTLRELVTVTTDHDEVWEFVGDVRMRVREGGFVRRADVSRRIARAGLSKSPRSGTNSS